MSRRLWSRRPLGLLLGAVLAVVAVAAAIGAVVGSGERTGTGPGPDFGAVRDGVCQAAAAARDGDTARARATFLDESHEGLHDLAAAAQERDRTAAARLLEAKQRVETGLEKGSSSLVDDLEVLAGATGRAMAAVGGRDPGPCRG